MSETQTCIPKSSFIIILGLSGAVFLLGLIMLILQFIPAVGLEAVDFTNGTTWFSILTIILGGGGAFIAFMGKKK